MATAEQRARANIDKLLEHAGWSVQDVEAVNLIAAPYFAPRECERNPAFERAVEAASYRRGTPCRSNIQHCAN